MGGMAGSSMNGSSGGSPYTYSGPVNPNYNLGGGGMGGGYDMSGGQVGGGFGGQGI
jgi:hypothetical protein